MKRFFSKNQNVGPCVCYNDAMSKQYKLITAFFLMVKQCCCVTLLFYVYILKHTQICYILKYYTYSAGRILMLLASLLLCTFI